VSTQPELPVRCCTAHAPVIRIDRHSAMTASASRCKMTMQKPANRPKRQRFVKYALSLSPVSPGSSL
jgi:hypothetical protein